MKQRILIVEDDPSIRTGLVDLLDSEGFAISTADDGDEALHRFDQDHPDLVLLDVMIPEKSGYEVCKLIRSKDKKTPVLMLTAKGQEVDKVVGLEIGADDYIVKPFGIAELLARVRAALRRAYASGEKAVDDSPISFGNILADPKTLTAKRAGVAFDISAREVALLREFKQHDGEVLDRMALLERVWGVRYEGTTRTLDQHIAKLRQKIEDDPSNPNILTVHGSGYRFISHPEKSNDT